MCDFPKIAGFLITVKTLYLAAVVALGVGAVNAGSLVLAAANIPLMVGVIAGTGIAIGFSQAAIDEAIKCSTGPCGPSVSVLIARLRGYRNGLIVFASLLTAAAIVAWIPFVGAAALGGVLAWATVFTAGTMIPISFFLAAAFRAFQSCQAPSSTGASGFVTFLAYANFVVTAAMIGLGLEYGYLPEFPPPPPSHA